MSYYPNGMVRQVIHGDRVADAFVKDPNDMGRPARISTSNAASNWESGTFEFDGAGNMVEPIQWSALAGQL